MLLGDKHVQRRHNKKRENRSDRHSADEHETDRISRRSTCAAHQREGKMTGDRCNTGHHDRAQTNPRRLCDRGKLSLAMTLQLISELDNQDSVFRDEANERDEADLRVDVERSRPTIGEEMSERDFQKHEEPRAEHGERDRSQQNNKRIAEAVELRCQDEKDQHEREQKYSEKLAAFRAQLA